MKRLGNSAQSRQPIRPNHRQFRTLAALRDMLRSRLFCGGIKHGDVSIRSGNSTNNSGSLSTTTLSITITIAN